MKISARLNLLSLASILVTTLAVLAVSVLFLEPALRQSFERMMQLELQTATQAIRQKLDRSGVMAATKEAEAQLQQLRAKEGFATATLFVVDAADNMVVYQSDAAFDAHASNDFIAEMFRRRSGSLQYEHGGEVRVAVFSTLRPIDWLVGVAVLRHAVYAPMFDFVCAIAVITFAALCLNAIAVRLFGRRLMLRVQAALQCVNRIEAGESSARIAGSDANDEIGALQRGINTMADRNEQRTSEQRQAQEAFRASQARLQRLVESSIIGVFFYDMSGGIEESNDAFLQIIGFSRDDMDAGLVNWALLTPEQDVEADRFAAEQLRASGRCRPYEKHYVRKDGSLVPVLIGAVQLAETSERGVAFVVDLTERRQAEADRLARQQAEAANRAKSDFLSSMSHELRTPLNAVLGFGQLLEIDSQPPLSLRQREFVTRILDAGQHLLTLINEVLDLAHIESGKFTLSPEPVPLAPLIDECIALVRPLANRQGVVLAAPNKTCLEYVLADRVRLKQVLLNLLSNAIKYNREGGSASVECGRSGGSVQLRVSDTGQGLSAEQLARLFVPFERLGAERGAIEGTGIGLVLARRLVEMMEGEIGVESTAGVGTTFWIRLPAAEDDAVVDSSDSGLGDLALYPVPRGQRHKVLCIEDNAANLELIEQIVALRSDAKLIGATMPSIALALAAAHRPSLILMDINLPEMDGYALLTCLRENPITRNMAVVAISANAMPKDLERASAAGFADYLTKPLNIKRFNRMLDVMLAAVPPEPNP